MSQILKQLCFPRMLLNIWININERFAKDDRIRISLLHFAINNLKQGSKFVLDYFTKMKWLSEDLNTHRPMPICTCVHQSRCQSMHFARNFTKSCNGWSGKSLSRFCTHCGPTCHTIGVCFTKHGFPLNTGKPNTSACVFGNEGCESILIKSSIFT